MEMIRGLGRIGALMAIAVTLNGMASAQVQPSIPTFTAAQAEQGQAAYRQSCQDCHGSELDNGEFGGPPLKGGYFRGRWGSGSVAVPMQGTIVKLLVAVGTVVEAGQAVCVLEAMKMENQINAEKTGTVKEIRVELGGTVAAGDIVMVIE